MGATASDGAFAARGFRLKQRGIKVRKVFQFQAWNFLADETLNRLQRGKFFAGDERESVADVLRAAGASDRCT